MFFKASSWWLITALLLGVGIGGALLARWIVNYGGELLNLSDLVGEIGWLPVIVAGLAWGLVYATAGGIEADNPVETLFPMFEAYDDLFGPIDVSDFIRGLFTAFPINVLLAAVLAVGLGILAAAQLEADFQGVAHLTFGIVSFIQMIWFFTSSLV